MSQSSDGSFQVQERFSAVDSSATCTQTSVSTGLVVVDSNTPKIQISIPKSGVQSALGRTFNNSCPVDFFWNGVEVMLPPWDSFDEDGFDNRQDFTDTYGSGSFNSTHAGESLLVFCMSPTQKHSIAHQ